MTPEKLREIEAELAEKFAAFARQADREDAAAARQEELPQELQDLARRTARIEGALAELDRLEQAGEPMPGRIPLTDPESRITPNKEGGFAANAHIGAHAGDVPPRGTKTRTTDAPSARDAETPLAGVDVDSGLIVTGDVIAGVDEEHSLLQAVQAVEEQFGEKPEAVLADGRFATDPTSRRSTNKTSRSTPPAASRIRSATRRSARISRSRCRPMSTSGCRRRTSKAAANWTRRPSSMMRSRTVTAVRRASR